MDRVEAEACIVCRITPWPSGTCRGPLYEDELMVISQAQLWGGEEEHYLGHLFIEPRHHSAELADLSAAEGQLIGLFTMRLARALMETEGAEHVYSFVIGDGVPHVHVHVIGRYPGAPRKYWGPRVDEWPDAPRGAEDEIAQAADRIRCYLEEESG